MFEPQNPLERSLMQAADEPAHRAQFYRDFLAADIYLLPAGDVPETIDGVVPGGATLQLQTMERDGKNYLPFFSSLPRLQTAIEGERKYWRLAVRPFLEMTKGSTLLLNPGSDYGKEFVPDEVTGLLDGSIFLPERHVVERASHGAGRVMSRTKAMQSFTWSATKKLLAERGVELLSAGLDEVPGVYKDIHAVMAAQTDLVEVLGQFDPKLVKMCPAGDRAEA